MNRVLLAALTFTAVVHAQVIRSETQVVLVDVAVTDKKGGYPDDLKASEFHVWEDGKEQKITSVTRAAPGSEPNARARNVVLLFDNATMTAREQTWAHQVARDFIDATAESGVMMAVVHFGGVLRVGQTFTDNMLRLKQAIGASTVNTVSSVGDVNADRAVADFSTQDTLRSLQNLLRNLETVPGRKSLVYFTPGFQMGSGYTPQVRAVLAAANRSNVAIYPVSVRLTDSMPVAETLPISAGPGRGRVAIGASAGLARGAPTGIAADVGNPQADAAARLSVLFSFAEDSGGFVVRQPDDTELLRRIIREQREYYLLGYTPSAESAGTCHKLRVRVDRKDIEWRARAEYCNAAPSDILSGDPAARTLEARAMADDPGGLDATLQAAYFYTGRNRARTLVAMEIDPQAIAFKREDGKFRATLNVLGIARGEAAGNAARFSDTVKLEFPTQAEVDRFKKTAYRYENQFDAAPGEYTLTIVIAAGDQFGRVEEPLGIVARNNNEFGLSSLALSTSFRDANASAVDAALDELLVNDRKKLVVNGAELVMAGSKKLDEANLAGVFFEIYEPLLAEVGGSEKLVVAIQMRIIDVFTKRVHRDTTLLRLDLAGQGLNPVIPLGQTIPIEDLASGAYLLELQALDNSGNFAKRTIEFEIE